MILAAADYAEGKGNPPPDLVDWLQTKNFGHLPYSGGWKEQPARLIERYTLYRVYRSIIEYRHAAKNGKAFKGWIKDNKDTMKIVQGVKDLRNAISDTS